MGTVEWYITGGQMLLSFSFEKYIHIQFLNGNMTIKGLKVAVNIKENNRNRIKKGSMIVRKIELEKDFQK